MRIGIIGGGTAGYMAAAHLTKFTPWATLFHIYDSRIPSIGVGEGTTPPFVSWIHEITGLDFEALQPICDMTWKYGIRFENWGQKRPFYLNYFAPIEGAAYHISASKLTTFLQNYIQATYLDRQVTDVRVNGESSIVDFADGESLEVDFVIDATGFPRTKQDTHTYFSGVPTNAAVIRRGPPNDYQIATRAIARPYGWMFVIPLISSTSYGYIYNNTINDEADILADLNTFFEEEGVTPQDRHKSLQFPNFAQNSFFDGHQFKIGNAASFFEPLEATAIGVIVLQLRLISFWLIDLHLGLSENGRSPQAIDHINQHLSQTAQKIALFLSWHYAEGSSFDTPFWDYAQVCFSEMLEQVPPNIRQEFDQFIIAGSHYSKESITTIEKPSDFEHIVTPPNAMQRTFGGFLDIGFAQVGYGIGYF